jgi:hypothetical protein
MSGKHLLRLSFLLFGIQLCAACGRRQMVEGPNSSEEFQAAIYKASSGDTIDLLPISYRGDFLLQAKDAGDHITIRGNSDPKDPEKHTRIYGSGTVFKFLKGVWTLRALDIQSGDVGVEMNGDENTLMSTSINGVNTGVTIKGNANSVESTSISARSSGIIVQGSKNTVKSTSIKGKG